MGKGKLAGDSVFQDMKPGKLGCFLEYGCAVCKKTPRDVTSLSKCSKCKLVRYCSKEHQTEDWTEHKRVCDFYNRVMSELSKVQCEVSEEVWNATKISILEALEQDLGKPASFRQKDPLVRIPVCQVCFKLKDTAPCTSCYGASFCSDHTKAGKEKHKGACLAFVVAVGAQKVLAEQEDDAFPVWVPEKIEQEYGEFPTNWDDYCQRRRVPFFAPDYWCILTDALSFPMTIAYSLHSLLKSAVRDAEALTIHILGPSTSAEMLGSFKFEEILHVFPNLAKLNLILIGPDVPSSLHNKTSEGQLCRLCADAKRSLNFTHHSQRYHEFLPEAEAEAGFEPPELVIAFNSGLHDDLNSWEPTLQVLCERSIPAVFTSLNDHECQQDATIARSFGANFRMQPQPNPFRALLPHREQFDVNGYYQSNMFIFAF